MCVHVCVYQSHNSKVHKTFLSNALLQHRERISESQTLVMPGIIQKAQLHRVRGAVLIFTSSKGSTGVRGRCSVMDQPLQAIGSCGWVRHSDWSACPAPAFSITSLLLATHNFFWFGHHFLFPCFSLSVFAHGLSSTWGTLLLLFTLKLYLKCYLVNRVLQIKKLHADPLPL